MIVFIKLLDKTKYELEIDEKKAVLELKNMIYDKLNIHILNQRLIYNGFTLVDYNSINQYNIINNSTIYLIYQMY